MHSQACCQSRQLRRSLQIQMAKRTSKPSKSQGSGKRNHASCRSSPSSASPMNSYRHPDADVATRPEIGTQSQFRKKKAPKTYKYDSSLSPALEWDGQNAAREEGERLLQAILTASSLETAKESAEHLARLSKPFLNWAGKAERLSFDVPTLPLFVHERLSTQAILETLKRHRADKQTDMFDLFADPQRSITDQVLKAYEHRDKWVNRLILGDSLVVMNSLLEYEGLGGQVQMIYIDPPYGVKFGSNFQPFVRKREVKHNDDMQMTREPEMVQAYRDTWELGLHSYLTYFRDRLLLAKDLLTPAGSVFVQISDENLHRVRTVLDEVFGADNFVSLIAYTTSGGFAASTLSRAGDYLLWYARDINQVKYRKLYRTKRSPIGDVSSKYDQLELPDGTRRAMTSTEKTGEGDIPEGAKVFRVDNVISQGAAKEANQVYRYLDNDYQPGSGSHWKANFPDGMDRLANANRLVVSDRGKLGYVRYFDDFRAVSFTNLWVDIGGSVQSRSDRKIYAVQTGTSLIERCMLMTTDAGDLVLDPTCGSGTTAYVAEKWGRRWITIDTSRVPLALTRQRLLTSSYDWYALADESRGPAGGFAYGRRQNNRGEEVGGIVPHITLGSIANNEPAREEVLVDRPEINKEITRVAGPFVVEATIPTPVDFEGDGLEGGNVAPREEVGSFVDRMIEILRKSPNIQLPGNQRVALRNVRPTARSLSLSAEAVVEASAAGQAPSLSDVVDEAEEKRGDRLSLSMKAVAIVFWS